MIKVAPSVMCADYMRLGEHIRAVEEGGADWLHLDVMDGHFVPGFTFGADLIKQLRAVTHLPLDVHLMSDRPLEHMHDYLGLGIDMLTVHAEATYDLFRCVATVKRAGVRAGVALNPATPLSVLEDILPELDCVLIMTVAPGFIGQSLIPSALKKAGTLVRELKNNNMNHIQVVVDGGVKIHNIEQIAAQGIDGVVSGTGVFQLEDIPSGIREMKRRSLHVTAGSGT
ncbi:ribulose-phosphate 3-epimerase [Tumebacillus algifaecis]|uniref:Ribulose-phosphate 3-epimerase n=1 Tax=Tumebacillus algifaecis TaxID=1214604 RepID=A0A223CWG7_9BACL|nr:ribulose-phosphate 3-epimerase [Tumebacillus algifaecis]ASS73668.1 ribulose-phosphate 3-epimerase [Tumebacillus algifaecis]